MLLKCWRTIAASVCHGDTGARSMSFDSDVSCSNSAISCCSQWAQYVLLDAVRLTPAAATVNAAGMRGGEKQSDGLSWAAYWGFHVGGHLASKCDLMMNVTEQWNENTQSQKLTRYVDIRFFSCMFSKLMFEVGFGWIGSKVNILLLGWVLVQKIDP